MSLVLNDENFGKEIQNTDKLVLVDFFAVWCGPCSTLAPILEKVADDLKNSVVLVKADIDKIPLTAQKFGIDRIPAVFVFKAGKPIDSFVGVRAEDDIKKWIEKIEIEELNKWSADYAKKNGFKLNPDKEVVQRLMKGLLENEKKHGQKYCPCRRVTGNKEVDSKSVCPCYYHLDEIKKDGHCLCGLFVK